MKTVITDFIELSQSAVDRLNKLNVEIFNDTPNDETVIVERIKDAEIITANYIDITSAMIDAAPDLKYIIVPAVGYEWVDYKYAAAKGIKVINCPTHNSQAVAEHAFALLFALSRKLFDAQTSLRKGEWRQSDFSGTELAGKKLGIIGWGNIGRRVESIAIGIGMETQCINSQSSAKDLERLLEESNIVCVCAPLNQQTRNLLSADRLSLMKREAVIINISRGAIIDQNSLHDMLKTGRLAGAGLDVFAGEPLSGKPNNDIIALANLNNVVATPHIAYNTQETAERLGHELIKAVQSCLANNPENVVN